MVVFDATMMLLLMHPDVNPPLDFKSKLPVEHAEARISGLVQQMEKQKTKIIIPTPALSELLVRAGGDAQSLIDKIQKNYTFRIEPFNTLAAIEVAAMTRNAINGGDKRGGLDCTWAKIKYDRQIIAIAKVHGATAIYSDDEHIRTHASSANIPVIGLADIPIPSGELQTTIEELLNGEEGKEEVPKD
jgi:rRNA-processing protein FCF1